MSLPRFKDNQGNQQINCHSRYAPALEARRHLETSLSGRQPALLFILGAGQNYLGKELRQILPDSMTVVLQACTDFDTSLIDPGDLYWSPGSTYTLRSILTAALSSGKAAGGVAVIEWPPASRNHTAELEQIRTGLHQALELYSSEAATSAYWGRRWIKNSLDFVCGNGPLALPAVNSIPLVIACAGPSLHEALPAISTIRKNIRLWALASSHQALMVEGLEPELMFGTDPGFWHGAHLSLAARSGSIVAATPSTRLGSAILDNRCLIAPVCTGLGFELDALAAAGDIPSVAASAAGTAAGTALSAACTLTSGSIFLCGLDLAARGLREHVSPYAFDILDESSASRQHPALTSRFTRIMDRYPDSLGSWRLSRAFTAYAHDIASSISRETVFRVSSSPVETRLVCVTPEQLVSSIAAITSLRSTEAELRIFYRKGTVKSRLAAMLDRLSNRATTALLILKECASTGQAVPRETVLELFAFGGKGCAAAIASAARGAATENEILQAEKAISTCFSHLSGRNL